MKMNEDWKQDVLRLREEGSSWESLVDKYQGLFPDRSREQVRKKLSAVVFKAVKAKKSAVGKTPKTFREPKPLKSGQYESDWLIKIRKTDKITDELIMELHGLDPSKWEVISYINNGWHGQIKGGNRTELYQSKLYVRPRVVKITFEDVNHAFENVKFWTSRPLIPIVQYSPTGEVLEITVADVHTGLFSWARETGSPYDLNIARECLMHVISENLERCRGRKFQKIILADLGDMVHIDTAKLTTTNGTLQDADGPIQRIGEFAVYMVVDALTALGEIAPVDFLSVNGNHDIVTGYMLTLAVKMAFRNDKNITVDVEPNPQKYRIIGDSLIGFSHGEMPEKNLGGWLQVVARELSTPIHFIEDHSGHRHILKTKERIQAHDVDGIVIRTMPAITNASPWSHRSGYVARRASVSYIWNETAGLRDMWYCNM